MVGVRSVVGIALIVGLAGCSSGAHRASTPTSPSLGSAAVPSTVTTSPLAFDVPWIDRPAPRFVSLSRPLPPDNARPCTSSDVYVMAGVTEGVSSSMLFVEYHFTNKGRTTCSLGGFPATVVAADAAVVTGRRVARVRQGQRVVGRPVRRFVPPAALGICRTRL